MLQRKAIKNGKITGKILGFCHAGLQVVLCSTFMSRGKESTLVSFLKFPEIPFQEKVQKIPDETSPLLQRGGSLSH